MRISLVPYGPIREVVIACPVHQRCIGPYIERAAQQVFAQEVMRCLCLNCIPNQIKLAAWHLYWRDNP